MHTVDGSQLAYHQCLRTQPYAGGFNIVLPRIKSSMSTSSMSYLICSLSWVGSQMDDHHLDDFISIDPYMVQ